MKTLLKSTYLFITGIAFASIAHATTHIVTVQSFSFSPATVNAVVGDTIEWDWVGGSHTTTSLTIPGGAASWNNNINSSSTTFKYKVTVAGTYNYWCAIHTTMMEGVINVSTAAGVANVSASTQPIAKLYPNPATSLINIHLNITPGSNILVVNDILGKEVVRETLMNADNAIDVSVWKKGIYIYHLKNGTDDMEGKFEVQ
jgi:plastocyanin